MDFFFIFSVCILVLLLPVSVGGRGVFDVDKRILSVVIRLYGIKVFTLKLYFSDEGIFLSFNGKKGRLLIKKKKEKGENRPTFDILNAIRIRSLTLTASIAGDPFVLSCSLASSFAALSAVISALESRGVLDHARIRLFPRAAGKAATVDFSISLITSLAMLVGGFNHTINGEKYEKRSIGKHDG